MANIKRYSLAAFDPKTKKETLIGINVDDANKYVISGEKTFLAAIDKYTMNFNNAFELEYELLGMGVIDTPSKLYIRYEQKGTRKTPILYKENEGMGPFTEELATYVDRNSAHFKNLFNSLLKSSANVKYMEFMNQHGYINEYLYIKLNEYKNKKLASYTELEFVKNKIAENLTSYKTIRDIYIGSKRYKNSEALPIESEVPDTGKSIGEERIRLNEEEQKIIDLFLRGGEEEVYREYDNIPDKVLRKIDEYHKRGL